MSETKKTIMTITLKEVQTVAGLARLSLSDSHAESLTHELSKILEYVVKLDELDTSNVEPTSQVTVMSAPLRTDVVRPGLDRSDALAGAPRSDETGFLVPKFVDES